MSTWSGMHGIILIFVTSDAAARFIMMVWMLKLKIGLVDSEEGRDQGMWY